MIHGVKMAKEKMCYKYGDYIMREIKGRYYVYELETVNAEIKETYVGPLVDVVEAYIKLKEGWGDSPTVPRPGFEPGSRARKARILSVCITCT